MNRSRRCLPLAGDGGGIVLSVIGYAPGTYTVWFGSFLTDSYRYDVVVGPDGTGTSVPRTSNEARYEYGHSVKVTAYVEGVAVATAPADC